MNFSYADNSDKFVIGQNAFVKSDFKTAFSSWRSLAEAGCPTAQMTISYLYTTGKGIKKDRQKAFEWLSKAAKTGDANALYNLGLMYMRGQYVKKDTKKTYLLYARSAREGYLPARIFLADLLLKKVKDVALADKISWFSGAIVSYKRVSNLEKARIFETALVSLLEFNEQK